MEVALVVVGWLVFGILVLIGFLKIIKGRDKFERRWGVLYLLFSLPVLAALTIEGVGVAMLTFGTVVFFIYVACTGSTGSTSSRSSSGGWSGTGNSSYGGSYGTSHSSSTSNGISFTPTNYDTGRADAGAPAGTRDYDRAGGASQQGR